MSTGKLKISRLPSNGSKSTVLKIIRDNAPVSRSAIARISGMTVPAVSRTVTELLDDKLVMDKPLADKDGPRRKRGLLLNPNAGHVLGVSILPDGLEGCVLDTSYNPIFTVKHPQSLAEAPEQEILQQLFTFIEHLRSQVPANNKKCLSLAIIAPGLVDAEARTCIGSSTIRNWQRVAIADILEERFSLPVFLTTGSIAHLRVVERIEMEKPARDIMYVRYCDGIGVSMKLQNVYIAGHDMLAGEIGHMVVTDEEIPCNCGGVGCLEAVAAYGALARQARRAIEEGCTTILTEQEKVDGPAVLRAAAKGDRLAVRLVSSAFKLLGRTVAGVISCLAPQLVFLDHTLGLAGEDAFDALTQAIKANLLPQHRRDLDLRLSKIDSYLSCLGAAAAAMDESLEYSNA